MGGSRNERWNERLAKLRAMLTAKAKPLPPAPPKCRRVSGPEPRIVPSDWWNHPEQVAPQCALCHERVLPGEPLKRGLCGICWTRTTDQTPDAA